MCVFFFNDTATTEIYTLSLHDALPISLFDIDVADEDFQPGRAQRPLRSEEHTSELQSRSDLVCRLLLEKKQTHRSKLLGLLAVQAVKLFRPLGLVFF